MPKNCAMEISDLARVLVDTSVWIEFFRKHEPYHGIVSRLIDDEQIFCCGIILAERLGCETADGIGASPLTSVVPLGSAASSETSSCGSSPCSSGAELAQAGAAVGAGATMRRAGATTGGTRDSSTAAVKPGSD